MASHRRHKAIIAKAKGFRNRRKNVLKLVKNAVAKAGTNAYIGRRLKKRDMRSLWIVRLNAACRAQGLLCASCGRVFTTVRRAERVSQRLLAARGEDAIGEELRKLCPQCRGKRAFFTYADWTAGRGGP